MPHRTQFSNEKVFQSHLNKLETPNTMYYSKNSVVYPFKETLIKTLQTVTNVLPSYDPQQYFKFSQERIQNQTIREFEIMRNKPQKTQAAQYHWYQKSLRSDTRSSSIKFISEPMKNNENFFSKVENQTEYSKSNIDDYITNINTQIEDIRHNKALNPQKISISLIFESPEPTPTRRFLFSEYKTDSSMQDKTVIYVSNKDIQHGVPNNSFRETSSINTTSINYDNFYLTPSQKLSKTSNYVLLTHDTIPSHGLNNNFIPTNPLSNPNYYVSSTTTIFNTNFFTPVPNFTTENQASIESISNEALYSYESSEIYSGISRISQNSPSLSNSIDFTFWTLNGVLQKSPPTIEAALKIPSGQSLINKNIQHRTIRSCLRDPKCKCILKSLLNDAKCS
ncbi:hypothetical protein AYI68_g4736 [Smittium mucronatum]|uniref:Uncharacterized protein n=1 Tax=Smittium mucronatum TaxID=133383 RepID=A0A1R0GWA0_9FUNG|nr:hypothetical protein AYI68_g4736 [Smittium mucronatum]